MKNEKKKWNEIYIYLNEISTYTTNSLSNFLYDMKILWYEREKKIKETKNKGKKIHKFEWDIYTYLDSTIEVSVSYEDSVIVKRKEE